jgi:hypothetical protein
VVKGRNTGSDPAVAIRNMGSNPALKPPPAHDTMAPPVALEPTEPLADQFEPADTIAMVEQTAVVGRRRRGLVIAASAAIVLLAGFAVWGFTTTDDATRPPRTAQPIAPVAPVTVEQIPAASHAVPAPPRAGDEIEEIEMTPEDPPPGPSHPVHDASHRPAHRDTRPLPVAVPAALTREQLGQKFQQIRREYDSYKAKFGSRLEREWGEFATSIQYLTASGDDAGRKEASRKIDEFRGRMRE